MISKGDIIAFSLIIILSILAFLFWKDVRAMFGGRSEIAPTEIKENKRDKKKDKDDKKDKKNKEEEIINTDPDINSKITIAQKWELPDELKEISGIANIDNNRFACVQDEAGKIFIYNTATNKIEKSIPFAKPGDYEGIAIVGSTAYIASADGKIFEVNNYNSKPTITEHTTYLTAKDDVESLCYDKKNNRLLLAFKGDEKNGNDYKGIYAFNLSSKKLATTPVYKVDLTQKIWDNVKQKNKLQPSDIEIHPLTGDIYILDGGNPKLVVMKADGSKVDIYELATSEFRQPEGITFTKAADLYISNEGKTGAGNILKVLIK